MKNILHIHTSEHRNNYFYDRNESRLVFVHPLLKDMIQLTNDGLDMKDLSPSYLLEKFPEYSLDDITYYRNKYIHWKSTKLYDLQSEYSIDYSTKINPDDIKKQLANISQIVFEVTDDCNLKCYYCGYGELYDSYDERERVNLSKEKAFCLIDYFVDLWSSPLNVSANKRVYFSFYGGEPLMNVPLIQEIIDYIASKKLKDINPHYTMTTNAVFLRKYIGFLVKNEFEVLISLDGGRKNNSYRLFKNGKESFDLIYKNICYVKDTYPDYFERKVDFNSVLHNRNTVADIYGFIKGKFNKLPAIGELSTMGIREDTKKHFYATYRNTIESLHQQEDYATIEDEMFVSLPDSRNMVYFIHRYTGNVHREYTDFFTSKQKKNILPTGTCFPFSRKLFMTTNGKLLQCERIAHKYALGKVENNTLTMDFQVIADKFNYWYSLLEKQCKHCYRLGACSQCLFYVDNLESVSKCEGFASSQTLGDQIASSIYQLERKPEEYNRINKEIALI